MAVPVKLSCGCERRATEKAAKDLTVYCRFHGLVSVETVLWDEWHAVCLECSWGRWGSYGHCSYESGKHYRNKQHRTFVGQDRHPGHIRQSRDFLRFVAETASVPTASLIDSSHGVERGSDQPPPF